MRRKDMFKNLLIPLCLLPLLFCSSIAQTNVLSPANSTIFNVRDFGAIGDGKKLDSPAIDKAIEACAKAGGGTIYFPSGTYLSGSIHLKSNLHLYLDAGLIILGAPQEMKAYDPPESFEGTAYQDGGHTYFHNSLIWGENLANVSITGPGIINGGGLTRRDKDVGAGSISLGDKALALRHATTSSFATSQFSMGALRNHPYRMLRCCGGQRHDRHRSGRYKSRLLPKRRCLELSHQRTER